MSDDVKVVKESMARVQSHAASLRAVAKLFKAAASDAVQVEVERGKLEAIREAAGEQGVAARVSSTIRKRNLKIGEIVGRCAYASLAAPRPSCRAVPESRANL